MTSFLSASTKSMTGRLAFFFAVVSIIVGIFCFTMFTWALYWSEDRVGERRILFDKDLAIERYLAGEKGHIKLDFMTDAYNDLSLAPEKYRHLLAEHNYYLGESTEEGDGHMLYFSTYTDNGKTYPIFLLSEIDRVEFGDLELVYALSIVLVIVSVLMFSFGAILYKLSRRLIEPINQLTRQLEAQRGDTHKRFVVSEQAAIEFQMLSQELNQYRAEINSLIKREQAFARYASHELRTPLTIMQGSAKLLERGEKSPFQERQIKRISSATMQMKTMVDALLSIVRYERSKDDEAVERYLDEQELTQIVEQNRAQADDKQIEFIIDVEGTPLLLASEAVLNMVIGNLVRNAIAATKQGRITLRLTDKALFVTDEGSGLGSEPNPEGHGLGLLIVEHLCQRYSWSFQLNNQEQGGCEAKIQFTT